MRGQGKSTSATQANPLYGEPRQGAKISSPRRLSRSLASYNQLRERLGDEAHAEFLDPALAVAEIVAPRALEEERVTRAVEFFESLELGEQVQEAVEPNMVIADVTSVFAGQRWYGNEFTEDLAYKRSTGVINERIGGSMAHYVARDPEIERYILDKSDADPGSSLSEKEWRTVFCIWIRERGSKPALLADEIDKQLKRQAKSQSRSNI